MKPDAIELGKHPIFPFDYWYCDHCGYVKSHEQMGLEKYLYDCPRCRGKNFHFVKGLAQPTEGE